MSELGFEDQEQPFGGRAVRGGTLAAVGMFTSQAISFIGFIVLARLAPPTTFGAYAAAGILTGAGLLFSEAGMQAAVIQRSERIHEAASTAFTANIVGGLLLAGLAAALAPLVGLFFHSGEIARGAAVMAGTIPISAAAIVPGAVLQRHFSFRLPFVGPVAAFAFAFTAALALANGLRLWGLVFATYVAAATRTALIWRLSKWRPSFRLVSWKMWRSLSRYGRPVVLSMLLREIGFAGSTAVVGRALGTADLGRFRYGQRIVFQVNSAVVFGSAYVLLPLFSRIWHNERRFQHAILRALRTLSLVVFPLSLVFVPLGTPFATIILGEQWSGAGPIMMALAGVGVALALDSVSSEAFKATGRVHLLPRIHGLTAVVPLALMFPLLHFGAAGVGLAISLGMGVVAGYALYLLGRLADIPLTKILTQIMPAFGCASVMAVVVYLVEKYAIHAEGHEGASALALLVLEALGAALLYVGLLLLFSRRSVDELRGVASLLRGRGKSSASHAAE
jgi:PST family polysaccharide transporter